MADLPNRELATKLASGELSVIKLGGVAAGDSVAKVGDIATAAAIRDVKINANSAQLGTELLSGGELSVDVGNLTFTIAQTIYHHVDTWTDPENPVITKITKVQQAGITPQFLTTAPISVITMDKLGSVVQFDSIPTGEDAREYMSLGVIVHSNLTTISGVSNATQGNSINVAGTFADFRSAFGLVNLSGNVFSVSTLLALKKSAGVAFGVSQNFKTNPKDPNNVATIAADPQSLILTYQDGAGGWTNVASGSVDPSKYDDGSGTLATVTTNNWTIQPVWLATGSGTVVVGYGQAVYATKDDALLNVNVEAAEINPVVDGFILRCWVLTRGGAVDLAITTDGIIRQASKFGI